MNNETWFVITMNTKNGKKIYLKEGIGNSYEWTFDREQAIWFEFEDKAKEFANSYFKSFKNWFVEDFDYDYKGEI